MSLPATLNTSECFDDIISIKGSCSDQTPTSGLYLDQFGVNLAECNSYIGAEYEDGEELFEDKKQFAIELIANMILSAIQPKLKAASLISGHRTGFFNNNLESVTYDGTYPGGGIALTVDAGNSFLKLFISEITLHLNYTGTNYVYLADLRQDRILQTFEIQSVIGEYSTIYPQYEIDIPRQYTDLILFRDTTGKPSLKSTINSSGCLSCLPVNRNMMVSASAVKFNTGMQKIRANMQGSNDTAGISIVYNLSCDHRGFLCSISNLLAIPIGYKTASEVVDYGMNNTTGRINTSTIVDRDVMSKRKEELELRFSESLDNVMNNIRFTDHTCFECNRQVMNAIALP